jgi:hypothetical protein
MKESKVQEIEPGQSWVVDRFRPEDAEGVRRLFLSVYGEGYPVRTYLEPERLIRENADGRTLSSVARTPKGDVVGHNALFRSAPHPGVYESGAGLVHVAYRGGKGLFTRLVAHGQEEAGRRPGVDAIFGESVCNHVFSQKMCRSLGWGTMALEVDLMPVAAYTQEGSATGRVASLLDFRTIRSRPHRVFLPAVYEDDLRFLYQRLDDPRDLVPSEEPMPADGRTRIRTRRFDFAQVARMAVTEAGEDFEAALAKEEATLDAAGVQVNQVWIPLFEPWAGEAARVLRDRGYFLGGVLPRWFDRDGLLMQRIAVPPSWDGVILQFDRAKALLERVRADWEAVVANRGS